MTAGPTISGFDHGRAHDHPHGDTVREWLRPAGRWRCCPPGGGSGVTWVEREAEAAASPRCRRASCWPFTTATGGVLGGAPRKPRPSTRSGAQHARRYVAPRVALIGDAAHGVHPIHAQGFNMGVADIGALVEALVAARARGLDLGSGRRAAALCPPRRRDNARRLRLTDGLVRLFSTDLAPLRPARGLALDALERLPRSSGWRCATGCRPAERAGEA